ncbi:MAG TPA: hypothetical protein VF812_13415 [Ktedonobacterales bacterium]
MPNRYEREIEEILNKMEESEPRRGLGDRIRPLQRPPSRARSRSQVHVAFPEMLMLISIVLTLIAVGVAYFLGAADIVTGAIGMVALLLFVVALIVSWRDRFRPPLKSQWHGNTYVEVTPIRRRNPFSAIATQIRVIRLRMQYRRSQRDNGER